MHVSRNSKKKKDWNFMDVLLNGVSIKFYMCFRHI